MAAGGAVRRRAPRWCWLGLLILGLAGCGDPRDNPSWSLGGEPGLLWVIRQYYELNAYEEGTSCTSPLLDAVTRSQVTGEGTDRLVVELGYYYRDAFRDGGDCGEFRPLRCGVMRACRGFSERRFVIGKQGDQFQVLEMSGPQSGHRREPPSLPERQPPAAGKSDP